MQRGGVEIYQNKIKVLERVTGFKNAITGDLRK
jgi:hypothetical protein